MPDTQQNPAPLWRAGGSRRHWRGYLRPKHCRRGPPHCCTEALQTHTCDMLASPLISELALPCYTGATQMTHSRDENALCNLRNATFPCMSSKRLQKACPGYVGRGCGLKSHPAGTKIMPWWTTLLSAACNAQLQIHDLALPSLHCNTAPLVLNGSFAVINRKECPSSYHQVS